MLNKQQFSLADAMEFSLGELVYIKFDSAWDPESQKIGWHVTNELIDQMLEVDGHEE